MITKIKIPAVTEKSKIIKLNFGCGVYGQKKGFINIDKIAGPGVDLVYDLEKLPYSFKNNSVDEIYIAHVLEHLDLSVNDFFDELKRILKKGGLVELRVPIGLSAMSMFHKKFFSIGNFRTKNISDLEQIEFWKDWEITSIKLGFIKGGKTWFLNNFMEKLANSIRLDIYERSFLRYLFPADELIIKIIKT